MFCIEDCSKIPAGSPGGETECQYLSSRQYSELRQVIVGLSVATSGALP